MEARIKALRKMIVFSSTNMKRFEDGNEKKND